MTEIEYPFEIKEKYHYKKDITIWVVKLTQKLTREMFLELKDFAKLVNAYYSRSARGFVFETKPTDETLEEFAKTIETLQEKEKENFNPTELNLRPLSDQTVSGFNFYRMYQYDLNDEYEKIVKNKLIEIKKSTGLDYKNFTPLLFEVFEKYLKALQEYFQRKSKANMIFPNPFMTGRSGYKNLERKREKAQRCEEIGRGNLEKKEHSLKQVIKAHIKQKDTQEGNILSFDTLQTELIKPLRKLLKMDGWTIRQSAKGKRSGMEWRMFVIQKLDGSHGWWSFTINEMGRWSFGRYSESPIHLKTTSLTTIFDNLRKLLKKNEIVV